MLLIDRRFSQTDNRRVSAPIGVHLRQSAMRAETRPKAMLRPCESGSDLPATEHQRHLHLVPFSKKAPGVARLVGETTSTKFEAWPCVDARGISLPGHDTMAAD
jgi:hypothetical protein